MWFCSRVSEGIDSVGRSGAPRGLRSVGFERGVECEIWRSAQLLVGWRCCGSRVRFVAWWVVNLRRYDLGWGICRRNSIAQRAFVADAPEHDEDAQPDSITFHFLIFGQLGCDTPFHYTATHVIEQGTSHSEAGVHDGARRLASPAANPNTTDAAPTEHPITFDNGAFQPRKWRPRRRCPTRARGNLRPGNTRPRTSLSPRPREQR